MLGITYTFCQDNKKFVYTADITFQCRFDLTCESLSCFPTVSQDMLIGTDVDKQLSRSLKHVGDHFHCYIAINNNVDGIILSDIPSDNKLHAAGPFQLKFHALFCLRSGGFHKHWIRSIFNFRISVSPYISGPEIEYIHVHVYI